MKRILALSILLLAVLSVAACTAPAAPLQFHAAPWSDGETTTYDILSGNGATAGSATWTWKRTPEGWSQTHSTTLGGQQSGGEVVLSADLLPIRSTRPGAAGPVETTYGSDGIQIRPAGGAAKTLGRPVDAVDNEVSLQLQRALPLAAGYRTRYTDIIPATGAAAPVSLSVKGAETVTVPAGTFATWHVEMGFGGGRRARCVVCAGAAVSPRTLREPGFRRGLQSAWRHGIGV